MPDGWQLRGIPAPAQCLDQLHARRHPSRQDVDRGDLIRERRALRRDHLEIRRHPSFIPRHRQRQRLLGRCHGVCVLRSFLGEDAQRREIVLDILKGD